MEYDLDAVCVTCGHIFGNHKFGQNNCPKEDHDGVLDGYYSHSFFKSEVDTESEEWYDSGCSFDDDYDWTSSTC